MSNWNRYDDEEILEQCTDPDADLLQAVEEFAQFEPGLIESEQELSNMFDERVAECYDAETQLTYQNGLDLPMIREDFNNWTDMLCQDGELHPEQYQQYVYVGKFKTE